MKYNVGDKVRIKSLEWYNANKDKNGNVYVVGVSNYFTNNMAKFCGKIATIIGYVDEAMYYVLDIDDNEYAWYDWMLEDVKEDAVQQTEDVSNENDVKTLKIDVPEGYEIDEEKSSFKEIIFKKQTISITWNFIHNGVEIIAEDEHFVISCDIPPFYCTWNDAKRYIQNDDKWVLPTVKQLKLISKHHNKINEIINEHYGYLINGYAKIWSCEKGIFKNTAKCVNFDTDEIGGEDISKCSNIVYYVHNYNKNL